MPKSKDERAKAFTDRVLEEAEWFLETRGTIRSTSEHFNRPKNMIHQDITQRLPIIDPELSKKVNRLLKLNKDQRPYRGGEALRQKFKSDYKKSKKKED